MRCRDGFAGGVLEFNHDTGECHFVGVEFTVFVKIDVHATADGRDLPFAEIVIDAVQTLSQHDVDQRVIVVTEATGPGATDRTHAVFAVDVSSGLSFDDRVGVRREFVEEVLPLRIRLRRRDDGSGRVDEIQGHVADGFFTGVSHAIVVTIVIDLSRDRPRSSFAEVVGFAVTTRGQLDVADPSTVHRRPDRDEHTGSQRANVTRVGTAIDQTLRCDFDNAVDARVQILETITAIGAGVGRCDRLAAFIDQPNFDTRQRSAVSIVVVAVAVFSRSGEIDETADRTERQFTEVVVDTGVTAVENHVDDLVAWVDCRTDNLTRNRTGGILPVIQVSRLIDFDDAISSWHDVVKRIRPISFRRCGQRCLGGNGVDRFEPNEDSAQPDFASILGSRVVVVAIDKSTDRGGTWGLRDARHGRSRPVRQTFRVVTFVGRQVQTEVGFGIAVVVEENGIGGRLVVIRCFEDGFENRILKLLAGRDHVETLIELFEIGQVPQHFIDVDRKDQTVAGLEVGRSQD
ncbi:hypothetical protein RRSWK_02178 [Rhodopirellula sp. SWK7]|nr:hypothetical protein RRSWK_02178 [Rhodopirellula sp. SWK7]